MTSLRQATLSYKIQSKTKDDTFDHEFELIAKTFFPKTDLNDCLIRHINDRAALTKRFRKEYIGNRQSLQKTLLNKWRKCKHDIKLEDVDSDFKQEYKDHKIFNNQWYTRALFGAMTYIQLASKWIERYNNYQSVRKIWTSLVDKKPQLQGITKCLAAAHMENHCHPNKSLGLNIEAKWYYADKCAKDSELSIQADLYKTDDIAKIKTTFGTFDLVALIAFPFGSNDHSLFCKILGNISSLANKYIILYGASLLLQYHIKQNKDKATDNFKDELKKITQTIGCQSYSIYGKESVIFYK